MIPYQQSFNETVAKRYQRLAGPFREDAEKPLLEQMLGFMARTGARVLLVGEADGTNLWRLRSECETMAETERRLRKICAGKKKI